MRIGHEGRGLGKYSPVDIIFPVGGKVIVDD